MVTLERQDPVASALSESEPTKRYIYPYHPWRRYFARMFDLNFGGFVVIFVPSIVAAVIFPDAYYSFSSLGAYPILAGWLSLILWIPIEALFITLTGTTPGKWLCTIRVVAKDGGKLAFAAALKRSLLVWVFGMGLGIPFLNLAANADGYGWLKNRGTTHWDNEADAVVFHRQWSIVRRIVVVVIVVTLFFMQFVAVYSLMSSTMA